MATEQKIDCNYATGEVVKLKSGSSGRIRFIGTTLFSRDDNDLWCGIELFHGNEEERGVMKRNRGKFKNGKIIPQKGKAIRLFKCKSNGQAVLVRVSDITETLWTKETPEIIMNAKEFNSTHLSSAIAASSLKAVKHILNIAAFSDIKSNITTSILTILFRNNQFEILQALHTYLMEEHPQLPLFFSDNAMWIIMKYNIIDLYRKFCLKIDKWTMSELFIQFVIRELVWNMKNVERHFRLNSITKTRFEFADYIHIPNGRNIFISITADFDAEILNRKTDKEFNLRRIYGVSVHGRVMIENRNGISILMALLFMLDNKFTLKLMRKYKNEIKFEPIMLRLALEQHQYDKIQYELVKFLIDEAHLSLLEVPKQQMLCKNLVKKGWVKDVLNDRKYLNVLQFPINLYWKYSDLKEIESLSVNSDNEYFMLNLYGSLFMLLIHQCSIRNYKYSKRFLYCERYSCYECLGRDGITKNGKYLRDIIGLFVMNNA
eukprot:502861_1